jgi:perosamine synthetase
MAGDPGRIYPRLSVLSAGARDDLAVAGGAPAVTVVPRRWPFYSSRVEPVVRSIIASGEVSATHPHPLVEEVERRFLQLHDPDGLAIWCASGTSALFSAYFALSLSSQDEVLVPCMTFRATVTPLLLLNLRPVFYDANPVTGSIDLGDAASRLTSRTRALVITHLWGRPADMDAVCKFAAQHGLRIVEDCSHAHGAQWRGRPVGSFGAVSAFSAGTKKMVSGGTGGVLLTRDQDIYQRAVVFGQPKPRAERDVQNARLRPYARSGLGANLRGTPIAAALALDHLDRLPETIAIKNANLKLLDEALAATLPGLTPPIREDSWSAGAWYAYGCRWSDPRADREAIVDALRAEGVPVEAWGKPLHHLRVFTDPSPLTTVHYKNLPLVDCEGYPQADSLAATLVGWDTTELYEPAAAVIEQYAQAFAKMACALDADLVPAPRASTTLAP